MTGGDDINNGIGIVGVASTLGMVGNKRYVAEFKMFRKAIQKRFRCSVDDADCAIQHALEVGVIKTFKRNGNKYIKLIEEEM